MKIATKLTVSFLVVALLAVVISGVGVVNLRRLSLETMNNQQYITLPVENMSKFSIAYANVRSATRDLGRLTSAEDNEKQKTTLETNMALCQEHIAAYYKIAEENPSATQEELDAVKATNDAIIAYGDIVRGKLIPLGMANDSEGVYACISVDLSPYGTILRENVAFLTTFLSERGTNSAVQAEADFFTSVIVTVALLVLVLLVVVILVRHVSGLIVRPLLLIVNFMRRVGTTGDITLGEEERKGIEELSHVRDEIGELSNGLAALIGHITKISGVLEEIADGDLTGELEVMSEKDVMGISLKKTQDNLSEMFGEILAATEQVSDGSHQIAEGAQQLAEGATEQAATIEELSASMAEIARKTQDNADMAGRAAGLTGVITKNAAKGSQQMDEMMAAVGAINESSQSISKVIKVIEDIAFQTNILALNAAVEAARAGQHGKGFSVVADEVRNLAAKSAAAAKDTNQLIADSMDRAKHGSQIAEETATSLVEIVSGISESDQLIGEITSSSLAQNAAIGQINSGINQVTQVVQQSSATAEESAAASEELSGQSALLKQLISRFKLKNAKAAYRPQSMRYGQEQPAGETAFALSASSGYGKY